MTGKPTDDEIYGRAALKKGEPWIVPEALEHLKRIVRPEWYVFEWGCGGSTVFFSKRCWGVVGIEHNSEWIVRVHELMERHECPHNWTMRHVRGDGSGKPEGFRPYADVIREYDDEMFDLISIDGEASSRGWCLTNAIAKLKPGGYLLLDNSDWVKRDLGWERWDYVAKGLKWVGQPGTFDWHTSIWRKPEVEE